MKSTPAQRFDEQNLDCAKHVLNNPAKFAGEPFLLDWARRVMRRLGTEADQRHLPMDAEFQTGDSEIEVTR